MLVMRRVCCLLNRHSSSSLTVNCQSRSLHSSCSTVITRNERWKRSFCVEAAVRDIKEGRPITVPTTSSSKSESVEAEIKVVGTGDYRGLVSVTSRVCHFGDIFTFPGNLHGVVVYHWGDCAWVLLPDLFMGTADEEPSFSVGDTVCTTTDPALVNRPGLGVTVGDRMLGSCIDVFGRAIASDNAPAITDERRRFDPSYPDVWQRVRIKQPLLTGWKVIDALTPIGRGQSMLVYGDASVNKTPLALDAVRAQNEISSGDVKCVYVVVGKLEEEVVALKAKLAASGADKYTVIVAAPLPDDEAPSGRSAVTTFLAPFVGVTLAEHWRDKGQHSLVVYDDLSAHATAFDSLRQWASGADREIPHLAPAAEKDFLWRLLYSNLLQRCAKLKDGGGSLTALPLLHSSSALQPHELMSVADGHLRMCHTLPPPHIDITASLSRVGAHARSPALTSVLPTLRMQLLEAKDGQTASSTKDKWLSQVVNFLHQHSGRPLALDAQVAILLWATQASPPVTIPPARHSAFEAEAVEFLRRHSHTKALMDAVRSGGKVLAEDEKTALLWVLRAFAQAFVGRSQ